MSKKVEKIVVEKQEKETSMRFDRDWIQPIGKRGIAKQIEKSGKNMPMLRTAKEQEQYDQLMAPKRLRRSQFRESKKLQAKMAAIQSQGSANASA
jgi:hypothetical protein